MKRSESPSKIVTKTSPLYNLLKASIIVQIGNSVRFTSSLAQRYFFFVAFGPRAPQSYRPGSPIQFIKDVCCMMSPQRFKDSAAEGFPVEHTIQEFFFSGMLQLTPVDWFLSPERRIFNDDKKKKDSGTSSSKKGSRTSSSKKNQSSKNKDQSSDDKNKDEKKKESPGRIDFQVGGWGIELTVNGSQTQDHHRRMGPNGDYRCPTITKRIVVDVRSPEYHEPNPTVAHRHSDTYQTEYVVLKLESGFDSCVVHTLAPYKMWDKETVKLGKTVQEIVIRPGMDAKSSLIHT